MTALLHIFLFLITPAAIGAALVYKGRMEDIKQASK